VAGHAAADLELEHGGRVVRMLDEREAARLRDRDRPAVGDHVARALQHRPHGARLVRAAVGARLVLRLRRQQDPGRVLRPDRRHRLGLDAQQLLDLPLGLVVGTLAVVQRVQRAAGVPQVAARPALVAVHVPELELGVDHDRVRDRKPLDRAPDVLLVLRRGEAAGVDADDPQVRVALVPRLQVRHRPQRVHAAEVPELDQHRAAALLVHPQRRHVEPREPARERRRRDRVGLGAHRRPR